MEMYIQTHVDMRKHSKSEVAQVIQEGREQEGKKMGSAGNLDRAY